MMAKMKKHFSEYGITSRIVAWFLLLVIVPYLILTELIAAVFMNYTVSNMGTAAEDTMNSVGMQITDIMKEYEECSMNLYYSGYVELLENADKLSADEKQKIESVLTSTCYSTDGVRAVYVTAGNQIFRGGLDYFTVFQIMEPHKQEVRDAKGACLWYHTNRIFGEEEKNRYIMARSLNSKNRKNVGMLYMVIDGNAISEVFSQLQNEEQDRYLVTEDGTVLYSTKTKMLNKKLDISAVDTQKILSSQKVTVKGKKYLMTARHMMSLDWYCVTMLSIDQLKKTVLRMEFPFIVIGIVYGIFLLVMLRILKKYVFNPLRLLKKEMDQYAQGEIGIAQMESVGVGEFQSLSRHFNSMTVRISDLMSDYKKEVDEKNRQKMNALTSQLTPHFIYNALNTIKWMAVLNHQDNIQHLTESLVYIFMNAAKTDDEKYMVKDELELIKNYAVIQKARFMNFDLVIEADEQCQECHIRKLLLQPIVENAIVHGLARGKIKNSRILLKAWVDDALHIEIKDQGIGFDVEKWRKCSEKASGHTNIGIRNVEEIIALEYGAPYSVEINSVPGEGTTVRYYLPVIRKEQKDDSDNCGR